MLLYINITLLKTINIKINKYTLGIELEVGYKIDKKFFQF